MTSDPLETQGDCSAEYLLSVGHEGASQEATPSMTRRKGNTHRGLTPAEWRARTERKAHRRRNERLAMRQDHPDNVAMTPAQIHALTLKQRGVSGGDAATA